MLLLNLEISGSSLATIQMQEDKKVWKMSYCMQHVQIKRKKKLKENWEK